MSKKGTYIFLLFIGILFQFNEGFCQGFQTKFGKNVVQHKNFRWSYYQSPTFDVYFYEGGKEPARFIVENGEKSVKELESLLNYPLSEKITFILYNSYNDFRQSNYRMSEESYNIGGISPIVGNRVFIYFDGNHFNLINQIRGGLARVIFNEMIIGTNLQERIQNNVLLNIPDWFSEGFIRHTSNAWNPESESRFLSDVGQGKYDKFKNLTSEEQIEVGYALWNYFYEQYGQSIVSDLFFNTRLYRNVDDGLKNTFSKNFNQIYDEWLLYYKSKVIKTKGDNPITNGEELDLKNIHKKGLISKWSINGAGTSAAFSIQNSGVSKVYLYDFNKNKRKRIFRKGYKRKLDQVDGNYPISVFNPIKNEIVIFYERKSETFYSIYDITNSKTIKKQLISGVQSINDADFNPNGKNLVVTAIKNGQSDLYIFDLRTQLLKPLTDDIYDEKNPRFTDNGKSIVFSSNRPDKYLRKINSNNDYKFSNDFNVYKFPDWQVAPKSIYQISDLKGNEFHPDAYDSSFSAYLTDENGIVNINAAYTDSFFKYSAILVLKKEDLGLNPDTFRFYSKSKSDFLIPDSISKSAKILRLDTIYVFEEQIHTFPVTNYNNNLLGIKMFPRYRWQYEFFLYGGKYHLIKKVMPMDIRSLKIKKENNNFINPAFKNEIVSKTALEIKQIEENRLPELPDSLKKEYSHYFITEFSNPFQDTTGQFISSNRMKGAVSGNPFQNKERRGAKFAPEGIYELTYFPELVTSQIDNGLGNTNYQQYKKGDNTFFSNQVTGYFTVSVSDLLRDYKFTGGLRLLYSLSGAEFFISYENNKYILDQKFLVFRRSERKNDEIGNYFKEVSFEGRYEVKYSFSEVFAARGSLFVRNDQTNFLSTDKANLEKESKNNIWQGSKMELVFDNSFKRLLNLPTGIKAKVFSEYYYSLNVKKSFLYTLGLDGRFYLPLGKYAIWANRIAMGTSLGTAKIVYFLGGTDGWLVPKYNTDNEVDPTQTFQYKALVMNMRGFFQNTRNGNSYGVLNSELRLPIFRMLYKKQLRSSFFNNFQVTSFFDLGSAWNGFLPTGDNNNFNKKTLYANPFEITVTNKRDPFVYGFGYGFRTSLLGYFIRMDYGYGIDEKERQPRVFHLALGLDF